MITDADRARIAARYPARRTNWTMVVAGIILIGSLTAWGIWAGWEKSRPGVHGQLYGYQVISETAVKVTIDVHRPDPSRAATCTILAQAPSGETVGELELPVPAASAKDQRIETTVKTYLKAHTAFVQRCRLVER